MSLLPENKKKEKDITPKVFLIWGQSMSGKTYLAKHFPEPIILNTDGNGKKVGIPHIDITSFKMFVNVLKELEEGKHTFKTVVIDIVDDIKTFLDQYVCEKHGVETLADAPFGKAFGDVRATWQRLMIRLSHLPLNVVFISHIVSSVDEYDGSTIELPSLDQRSLNMTKGRTDVVIKCQKVGKNYMQICTEKRDIYTKEDFKDNALLEALKDVKYLFESEKKPEVKKVESKGLVKKAQEDNDDLNEEFEKALEEKNAKENKEEKVSENKEDTGSLLLKKKEG